MVLFDVPGWSVSDDPVVVPPKKRKRYSKQDVDKVQSATANIEKLMEQLASNPAVEKAPHEVKKGKKTGVVSAQYDQPPKKRRRHVKSNKAQEPQTPAAVEGAPAQDAPARKRKKDTPRVTTGEKVAGSSPTPSSRPPPQSLPSTLTSLQHGMKQSLDGARFRYVIHPPPFFSMDAQARISKNPAGGSTRSSTSRTALTHMP